MIRFYHRDDLENIACVAARDGDIAVCCHPLRMSLLTTAQRQEMMNGLLAEIGTPSQRAEIVATIIDLEQIRDRRTRRLAINN